MFYKLSTLVLFLMLAAPGVALAQGTGTLAGTVTDDFGGPLPGANVQLGGTTLGAAADSDGNYRIIGVPVGTYDVTASFVGFQSTTISGVTISSGYTQQLDFELPEGQIMDEIEIVYERPLIQKDAIGVPKVVTGEDIENLPVRGVADVAALQSGVVSEQGSDDLFIRGGREEEVVYFVDGVKVTSSSRLAINQQAIQEQEMLIGTIPARYGDVQSGVISITTKSGAEKFFGSAELITSEVLDDYGYNLASLSVGGPIVPGKASFFLSAGGTSIADNSPFFKERLQLTDGAYDALQANPQVFRIVGADGTARYVPVPTAGDPSAGLPLAGITQADLESDPTILNGFLSDEDQVQPGETIDGVPRAASEFITRDGFNSSVFSGAPFELIDGKDNPLRQLTFNGNVTVNPIESLSFRLGGSYQAQNVETYNYLRSFYNRDRAYQDNERTWQVYGNVRQRFGNSVFAQLQAEYTSFSERYNPTTFSDEVEDIVRYGDLSDPANEVVARYYRIDPVSGAYAQYENGAFSPGTSFGIFSNAGQELTFYRKRDESSFRLTGSTTAQLGVHQLEFGGEFERSTRRLFQVTGEQLASRIGREVNGVTVENYEDIPFVDFEAAGSYTYYGYNYTGTETVDGQDVAAFYNNDIGYGDAGYASKFDVAPYQPIYGGLYASDKIEYGDLVLNVGVRMDYFDNNTIVPFDLFDPYPILRANSEEFRNPDNDLYQGDDFAVPSNVDDDFAVYVADNAVIAYRDLDGNFYDASGNNINPDDVDNRVFNVGGTTVTDGPQQVSPETFVDYDPELTFMPRLGVSFPVTDRALFFASYNVTSQRPTEQAFAPFNDFRSLTGQNRISNPNLRPEKTTQYELGFRQRIAERATVTLSGFYRTQENKINVRELRNSSIGYSTFLNSDFTTTKGLEASVDLRRTQNLAFNANYTLSFAQGLGSDASSTGVIAWRGGYVPDVIYAADFDRRHVFNASLDYRLGENEGPEVFGVRAFENFGVNVLFQAQSGQPYSQIEAPGNIISGTQLTAPLGTVNSLRMPGSTLTNLRVDRNFNLGPASLRAYVWVQNLFDQEIINNVYRATGQPDNDGFIDQFSPTNPAETFAYQQLVEGPVNNSTGGFFASGEQGARFYGLPRRVRLGLLVNF
jgi:outer membrane receptor protein involved in Fe transport